MSEHTKEPWVQDGLYLRYIRPRVDGMPDGMDTIAEFCTGDTVSEGEAIAAARRAAVLSKACAGIPTEALENGKLGELITAVEVTLEDAFEDWPKIAPVGRGPLELMSVALAALRETEANE